MAHRRMADVLVACSAVAVALAASFAVAAGTITKYVYPDGRVVYSDRPVPGAKPEKEISIDKGPSMPRPPPGDVPPVAAGTAATATPPAAGPDDAPYAPVVAEAWDGRCHIRVTGVGEIFRVHVEGLVPDEPLDTESTSNGETITRVAPARSDGTYGLALFPAVLGESSGNVTFTVTGARCRVSVTFPWRLQ